MRFSPNRRSITAVQIGISLLIVVLGSMSARALSQVDDDLRIIYAEYTLAAAELAHISADIMRYRTAIIQALEAPSKKRFEEITAGLPMQRARIQNAIDRYAAASLRVSRSGRSEPDDLSAVKQSLEQYFAAASRTVSLLTQVWIAKSPDEAIRLRTQAELHAADNAGPKLIQISLALDRLLDTVADVAKDMRDEGTRTVSRATMLLTFGSLLIAVLNLVVGRVPPAEILASEPVPARLPPS
jgi:hypothetical protein